MMIRIIVTWKSGWYHATSTNLRGLFISTNTLDELLSEISIVLDRSKTIILARRTELTVSQTSI